MEWLIGVAALVVAVISALIAIWQGRLSKSQLKLAQDTEGETKRTLEAIKAETAETRRISQDIKANIDERITKILDNKIMAENASQAASAEISKAFMGKLMEGLGKPDSAQQ